MLSGEDANLTAERTEPERLQEAPAADFTGVAVVVVVVSSSSSSSGPSASSAIPGPCPRRRRRRRRLGLGSLVQEDDPRAVDDIRLDPPDVHRLLYLRHPHHVVVG